MQGESEKEVQAEFTTWHKKSVLKPPSPFEKQNVKNLYTYEAQKSIHI